MSKNRSSLALENDSLFLPLRSSAKKLSRERDQYNTNVNFNALWSRNLQFTFLCMIPGKIRCRRLFVSLSINVYFDWRSHCKSQSMIMDHVENDDANRAFIGLGKQKSKGRMSLSSFHIPSLFIFWKVGSTTAQISLKLVKLDQSWMIAVFFLKVSCIKTGKVMTQSSSQFKLCLQLIIGHL